MSRENLKRVLPFFFLKSVFFQKYLFKPWQNSVILKYLSCVKISLISSLANPFYNDKLSQDNTKIPCWSLVNLLLLPGSVLTHRDTVKFFYTPLECISEQLFPLFLKEFCTQLDCSVRLISVFLAGNSQQY